MIPNNDYKKYNATISNYTEIGKYITIRPSVTYSSSENQKVLRGASSYLLNLLVWPSFDDIRDYANADGTKIPLLLPIQTEN